MSQTAEFTAGEWLTLQLSPFWVLSSVTGTYRDFDPRDLETFADAVESAARAPGVVGREVFACVLQDLDGLRHAYVADGRTIAGGLCAVSDALAKVPVAEAQLFRSMLVDGVGADVARARGPYGRTMTAEDKQALELLTQLVAEGPRCCTIRVGAAWAR
ncbi:hypothetical protein BH20ACT6_BH20ACT6_13150 [soil metagenome]